MSKEKKEEEQTIQSAPANRIFSTLPTSQAIDEDYEIPKDWKAPDTVEKELSPLFADSIPENIDNRSDFLALQNLLYDQDPDKAAENLKDQGNLCLKKGKRGYTDAICYYSQAIDCNSPNNQHVSIYYSNRAQVHLLKGNFGRVIEDCQNSLQRNPSNIKSIFRLAKAQFGLNRYKDCLKTVDGGLLVELSPQNKELVGLKEEVTTCLDQEKKKAEDLQKEDYLKKMADVMKVKALFAKGFVVGTRVLHALQEDCKESIYFVPSSSYSSSSFSSSADLLALYKTVIAHPTAYTMHTPLLFCYAEHATTDLVQDAAEDDTLLQHLVPLLPMARLGKGKEMRNEKGIDNFNDEEKERQQLEADTGLTFLDEYPPWDKAQRYCLQNIALYFRKNMVPPVNVGGGGTGGGGDGSCVSSGSGSGNGASGMGKWVEVSISIRIGELLKMDGYVMPKFPILYVLDRGSIFTEAFLKD